MIRTLTQSDHSKVPGLAFHTMTLCDEYIVIYGGMKAEDKISGDLILLKETKSRFLIASYENNKNNFPHPRHSHSANYHKASGQLFIFGGSIGLKQKYSSEIWGLTVSSRPEFKLLPNELITPRCRSATFIVEDRLYIYGGFGTDKISKKFQILNDMYYYDINSQKIRSLITKGGVDMNNFLFKVVRLTEDFNSNDLNINPLSGSPENVNKYNYEASVKFAFFCSNLSMFFIFDLKTLVFTKVKPRFFVHQPRDNYIIEKLSDGRIVLFGGMEESVEQPLINFQNTSDNKCYNEAFVLTSFYYSQGEKDEDDFHYTWTDIDLFETNTKIIEEGYNGHASVVLKNDHILIFGGCNQSFSPVFNLINDFSSNQISFTNRLKTIDIFKTYQWLEPERKFIN